MDMDTHVKRIKASNHYKLRCGLKCRGPSMRLFGSAAASRGGGGGNCHGRRETCNSASNTRLAAKSTKPRPSSSRRVKNKNAVHPIDLRDLEQELALLPEPHHEPDIPVNVTASSQPAATTRGFTATISILHALDLPNPCQIRSCRHTFQPQVLVSTTRINDAQVVSLPAAHHAKNHSSWNKSASISYHIDASAATQLCVVRVQVAALCTRYPAEPVTVVIGDVDDLILVSPSDSASEVSQFYTVFRYHTLGERTIKYFAGKLKLRISIRPDDLPCPEPCTQNEQPPVVQDRLPPPATVPTSPSRPSFLPANFGDALQLKRKQLKATVVPEPVSQAVRAQAMEDPHKARELLESLHLRAQHHLIRLEDVQILEKVGEGVHACVRRARVNGLVSGGVDVAMKEFRYATTTSSSSDTCAVPLCVVQAFLQEYEMLQLVTTAFQDQNSNYSIGLLGVMLTPRLAIFTDFCHDGSLAKCLQDRALWCQVSMETKMELAVHITTGLAHLHSLNIVHRDIKAHNIMVDGVLTRHPVAKIGDLGSAVVKRPPDSLLTEETGSSGYTAPEIFSSSGYDQRADIWSLGVVLWELLCTNSSTKLENPFHGVVGDEVVRKAEAGERPSIPDGALPVWCESLLQRCWQLDPAARPTASEIAIQFVRFKNDTLQ